MYTKMLRSDKENDRDIISSLPDSIRLHILSFLPLKNAFQTRILSKKWSCVCSSLPILEFDRPRSMNARDFRDMVDEVLLFHDDLDIHKFSLGFTLDTDFISHRHLNAWISFAVRHNVKDCKLQLRKNEKLPGCLFTSTTLTTLDLGFIRDLSCPETIHLPMLKAFRLEFVGFDNENTTTKLFSDRACPVLERLSIIDCFFDDDFGTLTISNPSLKCLLIFLHKDLDVALSIPALQSIEYFGLSPPDISPETLSSLSNATLNFSLPDDEDELSFYESAIGVMKGLHNVHTLSLDKSFVENLARDPNLLADFPLAYPNLRHLCLETCATNNHFQVIIFLSKRAPNLQTLEIELENGISSNMIDTKTHLQSNELPTMECLRTIKIVNFEGRECELHLVQYFLENASILNEMVIRASLGTEYKKVVQQKLSSFRKLSPHVGISLTFDC